MSHCGSLLTSGIIGSQYMRRERASEKGPMAYRSTEIAPENTASLSQLSFILEYSKYIGWGTVTGESPNFHLTAHSYHKAPNTSISGSTVLL